jgi:hypothetical protein
VPPNSTATVWLPSPDEADIREGPTAAREAEGVKWVRREGNRDVWNVASGVYRFSVRTP